MFKIKLMNKISPIGLNKFNPNNYLLSDSLEEYDAVMVRSAALHETIFPKSLKAIARCGAGVNNIPVDKCTTDGIVVFNTPGANANGVKELALCALLLASRKVYEGINWANTLKDDPDAAKTVEKGKSAFAGTELFGKTLGVVGLGAIGRIVADAAINLGMKVIGYDPYLSEKVKSLLNQQVIVASSYDELYQTADYLTLHVPATPETKNMINEQTIALMKDDVKIINLSRADLVASTDIVKAVENKKVAKYITDFPTPATIGIDNIINIPHLGASTAESEDNCAINASLALQDFLVYGNILNSVNFPNVSLPNSENPRIGILYQNNPNVLLNITNILNQNKILIKNMTSATKGNNGYTLIEIDVANQNILKELETITSVYKVYSFNN